MLHSKTPVHFVPDLSSLRRVFELIKQLQEVEEDQRTQENRHLRVFESLVGCAVKREEAASLPKGFVQREEL